MQKFALQRKFVQENFYVVIIVFISIEVYENSRQTVGQHISVSENASSSPSVQFNFLQFLRKSSHLNTA